jgi:hypothetical protein
MEDQSTDGGPQHGPTHPLLSWIQKPSCFHGFFVGELLVKVQVICINIDLKVDNSEEKAYHSKESRENIKLSPFEKDEMVLLIVINDLLRFLHSELPRVVPGHRHIIPRHWILIVLLKTLLRVQRVCSQCPLPSQSPSGVAASLLASS